MRLLFIGSEVSLKNSPEGIVSRALLDGFIQNGTIVDLVSPSFSEDISVVGLNAHYVIKVGRGFIVNKIKKKASGLEGGGFYENSCRLVETLDIHDYDIIFVRSDPVSVHKVALFINEKYGLSCVCSFGDVGSVNPYMAKGLFSQVRNKNLGQIESKIIANLNVVTQTSSRSIDLYKASGFNTDNFIVLPNPITSYSAGSCVSTLSGYSDENLKAYSDIEVATSNHKFNVAFIGSLYGERKPDLMFDYFSRFDDVGLHIFGGVRNILYEKGGFLYRWMRERGLDNLKSTAKQRGVKNIYIWPFMPMALVNRLIDKNFDALINVDANFSPNPFLSSKVVQYLSYKKPILNFSNIGATTDLLERAGIKYFVGYSDSVIPKEFESVLDLCKPSIDISELYSTKNVTRSLLQDVNRFAFVRG